MDYASDQEIILDFIDEEKLLHDKNQKRISVQTLRDESQINFNQLLGGEWTLSNQSQQPYNSKKAIHELIIPEEKQQHISSNIISHHILQQDKPKITNTSQQVEMKSIFTIFESPEDVEDIELYLSSEIFHVFIKIVVIINFIGLLIADYSFRMDKVNGKLALISIDNAISLNFELFSNCVFTVEIILYFFSLRPVFTNYWVMLNIMGTLACWATIFFDPIENDELILFEIIHILRIIRGFRIIEVFDYLKDLFETFLGTLPDLGKIFYPLLIFVTFFTLVGQQLYLGANEYKCRATPFPVGQSWPAVDTTNMCGASLRKCPNSYCGNPYDYGLPLDQVEFLKSSSWNAVKYDNFFSALLVTYHYVFMTNFTPTIFRFARYINPMLTTFFFVFNAVVLFYILANLVFVGLSKAYLEKEKNLQKQKQNTFNENGELSKDQSQEQQQLSDNQKLVLKIVQIFEVFLIIFQSVVILYDYKNMPQHTKGDLSLIDFIITIIAIFVVLIHILILRMRFLKSVHHLVDVIMILFFVADIIFCLSKGYSLVYIKEDTSAALRAIKIVRILKILYVSESLFKYERNIVNIFFRTLKNMRYFLLMLLGIAVIFSFIGKILFSFRIRSTLNGDINIKDGLPYVINFESIYKSVIGILTLFENQRWSDTMYKYFQARGLWGALFFVVIVFFSHLLVTRLFMAVFFCNFRQDLQETMGLADEEDEKQNDQLKTQNHKNGEKTVIHEHNQVKSMEQHFDYGSSNSNQTKQNFKKHKMEEMLKNEKLFWFLDRNSCIVQTLKFIHESKTFYYLVLSGMAAQALTIVLRSNVDSDEKTLVLDSIENVAIAIYCLQFALGVISYGFYFCHESYLKRNHFNKINFFVIICLIVSNFPFIDKLYQLMIRRLIIIKVITILKTRRNKEMDIILKAIAKISTNFLRVLFIYFLFLLITSVIPLKLLKGTMYNCNNYHSFQGMTLKQTRNPVDCMNAGGDWKEDSQTFDNIFSAIVLMYQVVTSQSWTYFIELQVFNDTRWDIYFIVNFFFYNTCMLNIFVGLTVETYVYLKDKAYKLDLLKPSQKGWILIKNCINQLVPTPTIGSSKINGFVQEVTFQIVSHEYYNNFIDFLAYLNIILYAMTIYRASAEYTAILLYFKIAIMIIFCLDTLLKVYALRKEYFYLENSKVQLMGSIYIIFYGLINTAPLTNEEVRIINFFLAIFLLLRAKKFLFRFTWSKTLINSVIQILPKCIQIGSFLFLILFIYVAIGLQVLKHVKPSSVSDNYTTGFNNFYTGLMTLIKLASNESWFDQVTTFVRGSQSSDICYNIHGIEDAKLHNGMGCGTYLAYPLLLSYHIIMSLLILNLLIATMVSAYDENYQKQYNSVNVFQLQDCLELWKKYDPRGTGVIAYKKFWKLSSQIGILFGISKKKLIKSKQKFLQELNIPICQSTNPEDSSVLCYRFHDVITKFSKIKLQVSADKGDQNSNSIEFDIHPMIENQIQDYIVKVPQELYKNYKQFKNYTSGEMKYFFGLLRKMRSWKTHSKSKGQVKVSKLSRIIKTAMQKKVQEENLKNVLAFVTKQQAEFEKKRENTNQSMKKDRIPQKPKNILNQDSSDESQSDLVDSMHIHKGKHNQQNQKRLFDSEPNQKIQDELQKGQKQI